MPPINADSCQYCFLDVDIDEHRARLATAAAFVDATDSRYGFSSKNLLLLGGSEVSRIPELIESDHEWSSKNTECGGISIRPPTWGNRVSFLKRLAFCEYSIVRRKSVLTLHW